MNLNDSIKYDARSFLLIILRALEENRERFVPADLKTEAKSHPSHVLDT